MVPERVLTKEEWDILSDAAAESASDYRAIAGKALVSGDKTAISFWAKKAQKITDVLIKLENEYYEAHPDEDPDKKEEA